LCAPDCDIAVPVSRVGHHADNFLAQQLALAFDPVFESIGDSGFELAMRHLSFAEGALDILSTYRDAAPG